LSQLVLPVATVHASMANLIWFADEKVFIMSALSNMKGWNQVSRELETQPSRSFCVLVHCRAGSYSQQQKSSYPHKCVKAIVLGDFCGYNGKTSTICHQRTRWSLPSKQGSCPHKCVKAIVLTAPVETSKLVLTTYYDISITSRLAKIFNQQPYVIKRFSISIFSATTGKNFV